LVWLLFIASSMPSEHLTGEYSFGVIRNTSVAELLLGRPPMARDLPDFDPGTAPADPGGLFAVWLAAARVAGVLDPQVVTLSTVDPQGAPDARALVLRDVRGGGAEWVFAADADSPKGRQLAGNPAAALTAYWPAQGRQIRVRGLVEPAAPEVSAAEFLTRSPLSRAAVLVGRQSEPLDAPADYDTAVREAEQRLAAAPGTVAPGHTVYLLRAQEAEFWQGDPGRHHVRLRYRRTDGGWSRVLLWP
jgi:pyridoxamine 5'-phosphate oxidase